MAKRTIEKYVKDKFNYDVSALPDYVDSQNDELHTELVEGASFISRCDVMTGVKGDTDIQILDSALTTQSASSCGWNSVGGVTFTDESITNTRIKVQEAYCNETLNTKWTRMKNKIGANEQDLDNPFGDVIIAYKTMQLKNVMQRQVILGDTASVDANLVYFDGFKKQWDADASLLTATTPAVINDTNAFEALKAVATASPKLLRANGNLVEIICGEETAQACIDQIWNSKDYNAKLEFTTDDNGDLSFVLPTTTMTVRVVPELNGTADIYAIPYDYMFVAVDGTSDEDGMSLDYATEAQELRLDVKYRLGVQYIFPQYFVKGDKSA